MKNIYIKNVLLSLVFISFFSCSNDDGQELFSDSPADRIAETNLEVLRLLTSEAQGYKATYFTKNDEFGGFTFYMRFNTDGTVDMTSDFDDETGIQTSSYEVRLGTTSELVFTTRNHIQKLSDPLVGGLIGSGFRGTSVFQFFSNENGKITFRDVRNRDTATLVFEPSSFTDFDSQSVTSAEASLAQRQNILPTATSSVFQVLRIENAAGVSNFNLNYDSLRLHAKPTFVFDNGEITELNFGMAFNENGLVISPALEFEGETYTDFVFDEGTSSYTSSVNGTTATILFADWPPFITRDIVDISKIDEGEPLFLFRPTLGSNALTTAAHNAIIDNLNDFLGQFGISFFDYIFFFDFNDDGQVCEGQLLVRFNGFPSLRYCFSATTINDDNSFKMTYQVPFDQDSADFQFLAQDLIDFFNSTPGMVADLKGSFETDTNRFSNSSVTFTSLENPSLRVYGLFL